MRKSKIKVTLQYWSRESADCALLDTPFYRIQDIDGALSIPCSTPGCKLYVGDKLSKKTAEFVDKAHQVRVVSPR